MALTVEQSTLNNLGSTQRVTQGKGGSFASTLQESPNK